MSIVTLTCPAGSLPDNVLRLKAEAVAVINSQLQLNPDQGPEPRPVRLSFHMTARLLWRSPAVLLRTPANFLVSSLANRLEVSGQASAVHLRTFVDLARLQELKRTKQRTYWRRRSRRTRTCRSPSRSQNTAEREADKQRDDRGTADDNTVLRSCTGPRGRCGKPRLGHLKEPTTSIPMRATESVKGQAGRVLYDCKESI